MTFLAEAEQDMDTIAEYLAQFYAQTARNFFTKLKEQLKSLETMPYLCPAYGDDPFFRCLTLGDYQLFYSVDEKRHLVIVHHIWHSKRDIHQLMSGYRVRE